MFGDMLGIVILTLLTKVVQWINRDEVTEAKRKYNASNIEGNIITLCKQIVIRNMLLGF